MRAISEHRGRIGRNDWAEALATGESYIPRDSVAFVAFVLTA
jgi:hypothetical protein